MLDIRFCKNEKLILILTVCSLIPSCLSTRCYSCIGEECNYGECEGDLCYSGLHPVGPFTAETPMHTKGCATGASNQTEMFLNQTIKTFLSSPDAYFCDSNNCNAAKYVAKHAKKMKKTKPAYAVCKMETPFEDTEDVCLGDWCWVGMVHPRSSPEVRVLRGCSGVNIGVISGSYCISPPIVDLITHVPLFSVDNASTICFCNEGALCNRGVPPNLENTAPLMSIMVTYSQGVGIEITGQGNVWMIQPKELLPEPTFFSLSGPGFKLEVGTEWTPAGQEYQEIALRTTMAPVLEEDSSSVESGNGELSFNATNSRNVSSFNASGELDGAAIGGVSEPTRKETSPEEVVQPEKVVGVDSPATAAKVRKTSNGGAAGCRTELIFVINLVAMIVGVML